MCHQTCNWMISSSSFMLEVISQGLQFASAAVRSNFFGLGCPVYCVQPSLSLILLSFLLGLLFGSALTAYLGWILCPWLLNSEPRLLSSPPAAAPRYSVLAEYLNEPRGPSRRRGRWNHLLFSWPPGYYHWPCSPGHWSPTDFVNCFSLRVIFGSRCFSYCYWRFFWLGASWGCNRCGARDPWADSGFIRGLPFCLTCCWSPLWWVQLHLVRLGSKEPGLLESGLVQWRLGESIPQTGHLNWICGTGSTQWSAAQGLPARPSSKVPIPTGELLAPLWPTAPSISHAFPSEVEAKIYLQAAGHPSFETVQWWTKWMESSPWRT